MTDKTDIEALREFNFDVFMYGIRRDAPFDGSTLADSISDDEVRRAESAFTSLLKRTEKAEQEASDLASQLMACRCAASRYEKELAELRGEQGHGDTTVYMMPNVFASLVNTARDVALEYKNAQCLRDALSRELKGYFTLSRQPKPVVVRKIGHIDHDGGEHGEYFVELTDSAEIGRAVYVIEEGEAAGIVVKDGE